MLHGCMLYHPRHPIVSSCYLIHHLLIDDVVSLVNGCLLYVDFLKYYLYRKGNIQWSLKDLMQSLWRSSCDEYFGISFPYQSFLESRYYDIHVDKVTGAESHRWFPENSKVISLNCSTAPQSCITLISRGRGRPPGTVISVWAHVLDCRPMSPVEGAHPPS